MGSVLIREIRGLSIWPCAELPSGDRGSSIRLARSTTKSEPGALMSYTSTCAFVTITPYVGTRARHERRQRQYPLTIRRGSLRFAVHGPGGVDRTQDLGVRQRAVAIRISAVRNVANDLRPEEGLWAKDALHLDLADLSVTHRIRRLDQLNPRSSFGKGDPQAVAGDWTRTLRLHERADRDGASLQRENRRRVGDRRRERVGWWCGRGAGRGLRGRIRRHRCVCVRRNHHRRIGLRTRRCHHWGVGRCARRRRRVGRRARLGCRSGYPLAPADGSVRGRVCRRYRGVRRSSCAPEAYRSAVSVGALPECPSECLPPEAYRSACLLALPGCPVGRICRRQAYRSACRRRRRVGRRSPGCPSEYLPAQACRWPCLPASPYRSACPPGRRVGRRVRRRRRVGRRVGWGVGRRLGVDLCPGRRQRRSTPACRLRQRTTS